MFFADLIFPVFTMPYFWLLMPWALPLALASESAVFWFNYRKIGSWKLFAGVLGANAFSWFVGILITTVLPLPFAYAGVSEDPKTFAVHYHQPFLLIAFFIAFVFSTLLEYPVWKLVGRKQPFKSLFRTTLAANAASYLLLIIGVFISQGFSFES